MWWSYFISPLPTVRPVTLIQGLSDLTICEGDIAQLEVRFSQENVEGTWLKNGQPISATDRIHIVIDKLVHKLLIENVTKEDAGMYSFNVPAHGISTAGKLSVQSKVLLVHLSVSFNFIFVTECFLFFTCPVAASSAEECKEKKKRFENICQMKQISPNRLK